jgi:hypothetical protein
MYLPFTIALATAGTLSGSESHVEVSSKVGALALRQDALVKAVISVAVESPSSISTVIYRDALPTLVTLVEERSLGSPVSIETAVLESANPIITFTSSATATESTTSFSDLSSWPTKGKVAGAIVGSVLGLIFLGMLIYTLIAASRGINVCDCFGGCCGRDDDEEKNHLPSQLYNKNTTSENAS